MEPYCIRHKKFRCKCDDFQFMKYFTRLFSYSKYLDFMVKGLTNEDYVKPPEGFRAHKVKL